MEAKRFVVMGAGAIGGYLARVLSSDGHTVTIIDSDEEKRALVEEQLDAAFVKGNGSQVPTLEAAEVDRCDLFVAVSSSDEANLAASLLAKRLGAPRTVVRIDASKDVAHYGRTYERAFQVDLLLSTELLATTRILNLVLGYNTLEVEYLAGGRLQIRKALIGSDSILGERRLADVDLPADCLVLAFLSANGLTVPTGESRAQPGDDVLVVAKTDAIDDVEKRISGDSQSSGLVVIAGGGSTGHEVAAGLGHRVKRLKIIEASRSRAEELATEFPHCEIVHGDATDRSTLVAEGVADARTFIALTGHDETNLMACLLAQEVGAKKISALVTRSETSSLWRKVGLLDVVSPRSIAAERIRDYIDSNYQPRIVSLENDSAYFVQRRIHPNTPVAGERLADLEIPRNLIVAAILRADEPIIPHGDERLAVDDEVIVFAHASEIATVQLLFPGSELN
ncbi:MAG: Trk system potassium transporter TrkA [Myxococcota bacterium]|nr:Trk system potassium transporter TrkA [Myxococcota bacterium]